MKEETTDRGFQVVTHPGYASGHVCRVVGQSSAIGDYEDSMERPGSSFLWIGENHHLNREEVEQLKQNLVHWLRSGKLF